MTLASFSFILVGVLLNAAAQLLLDRKSVV